MEEVTFLMVAWETKRKKNRLKSIVTFEGTAPEI